MPDTRAAPPLVEVTEGALLGAWDKGLAVFKGIPYAAPPVEKLRFRRPEPPAKWGGRRDATTAGPIPPQARSRLAAVMGDFSHPQSEDCLTLNIWSPALEGPPAPVLFWVHGGAFTSGAGSLAWYSGASLARHGRIVVVTVNYRLGPLGFLYLPGVSDGNLGLYDQVAALEWVRANIGAFGGNPDAITVAGQSAGGRSAAHFLSHARTAGLFRRAILQSAPLGLPPVAPDAAAATARRYLERLGATASELQRLPTQRLIAAAGELAREMARFADSRIPFNTVTDGDLVAVDPLSAVAAGAGKNIDVMLGTTREESAAHLGVDAAARGAEAAQVDARAAELFGPAAAAVLDEIRRLRPQASPYAHLVELVSETTFGRGTVAFAEAQAGQGRPAYLYRFDWQSPDRRFGACHCLELPFVFDNFADWPDAPMLKGGDAVEMAGLARAMRDAWTAFVRTGNPNHPALPTWEPYETGQRQTMRFDAIVEPCGDLAGVGWRRPW